MKHLIIILIGSLVLILGFNNCSDVKFSGTPEAATSFAGASGSASADGPTDDELLESLPPEEKEVYRPISDLERDPSLADIYTCPGGSGILLCHFPSSMDGEHTICVGGVNAALTHSGHELSIDSNGQVEGDYLGPCKQIPVQ